VGEWFERYADKFGDEGAKKLFDAGGDALSERIKGAGGGLEDAYREALRLSLDEIRARDEAGGGTGFRMGVGGGLGLVAGDAVGFGDRFRDWFEDWDRCLTAKVAMRLDVLTERELRTGLGFSSPEEVLRATMERLDAQGAALKKDVRSIFLTERELPAELEGLLVARLPGLFNEALNALLVSEEYARAWKQARGEFERYAAEMLTAIKADTTVLVSGVALSNEKLDRLLAMEVRRAEAEDRIGATEARALQAEGAANEWKEKYLELARSAPSLDALLQTGDLEEAVRVKEEQREQERHRAAKTSLELARLHELRFEWDRALEAYREAWRLERNFEYGFRLAHFAYEQNREAEAIEVFEAARELSVSQPEVATTLNNLANLYGKVQRIGDAEKAFEESLTIKRALAKVDPEKYETEVASTLNNLAILYVETGRVREAKQSFEEALAMYRTLPHNMEARDLDSMAAILNNLGLIYGEIEKTGDAEAAFVEALSICRALAKANPKYQADVAATLKNTADLYKSLHRVDESEKAYDEALAMYRGLAKVNPEAHLPDLAMTLNTVGALYTGMSRLEEAEKVLDESLLLRRALAESNPVVHLRNLALTLNSLGSLYLKLRRGGKAEKAFNEALTIYRELARKNPAGYMRSIAKTLNDLGSLYAVTDRTSEAEAVFNEALTLYRTLAEAHSEAYLADVAMMQLNLGLICESTKRTKEALELFVDAETILRPCWAKNRDLHGDMMGKILRAQADLCGEQGQTARACEVAREALGMAYAPALRAKIEQAIARWCGESSEPLQ
jgi:tetratricopeptide (TPR) repeat protein